MSAQDLLIWKERTKSFAEEIKEKAAVLQYVPPIEISLGVTIPGRQGYIDTCMQFEQMLWLCPECSYPMEGGRCKVCDSESERYRDPDPWACAKCDRVFEKGKCKDCER